MKALLQLFGVLLLAIGAPALAANSLQPATGASESAQRRAQMLAGLPYWPGIWEQYDIGPSGFPTGPNGEEQPFNVVSAGIGGFHPQFTTEWKKKMELDSKPHPETDRLCTFGFPWLMETSPLMFQIIITPEETTMIFNLREIRHIYTDGKGHTPDDVRLVTPWGDSVGHWDGDTLVVDTIGTTSRVWFDDNGKLGSAVLSEQAIFHERLRLLSSGRLEDRFLITDPMALKSPWEFERQYHRIPGMARMIEEEDCEGGNDRNPIVNGKWTLAPPQH